MMTTREPIAHPASTPRPDTQGGHRHTGQRRKGSPSPVTNPVRTRSQYPTPTYPFAPSAFALDERTLLRRRRPRPSSARASLGYRGTYDPSLRSASSTRRERRTQRRVQRITLFLFMVGCILIDYAASRLR